MNKLKELREANNLTQQQLADMLGLDRTTVGKWEIGASLPRGATLIKLARIFKCTTDELLCV